MANLSDYKVDPNDLDTVRWVASQLVGPSPSDDNTQPEALTVTRVAGGITNLLFRVEGLSRPCLVRVFGAEGMIDRTVENATFQALAEEGVGPPYYGRFANGRVEGWMEGMRHLQVRELPDVLEGVAQSLAQLHGSFVIPPHLEPHYQQPSLWTQLDDWWQQSIHNTYQTDADTERATALDLPSLRHELDWLRRDVVPPNAKVAFCHNDLLAANILVDDQRSQIQLIDFEYGGLNYCAFDVANHFNEFAGGPPLDPTPHYEWLPSVDQQRRFCKAYLEAVDKKDTVTDDQVDALVDQVQAFLLVNHLYWGLWAVNQAATEGCDEFDYMEYGTQRIRQYHVCKRSSERVHGLVSLAAKTPSLL